MVGIAAVAVVVIVGGVGGGASVAATRAPSGLIGHINKPSRYSDEKQQ